MVVETPKLLDGLSGSSQFSFRPTLDWTSKTRIVLLALVISICLLPKIYIYLVSKKIYIYLA